MGKTRIMMANTIILICPRQHDNISHLISSMCLRLCIVFYFTFGIKIAKLSEFNFIPQGHTINKKHTWKKKTKQLCSKHIFTASFKELNIFLNKVNLMHSLRHTHIHAYIGN